ncbi:MAG: helix-turn-helix domain-containing protein [Anaerolineales bacterium]|nr:helix-turn-helix domain-containing protein [Anaerolineales bacterium]
MPGNPFIVDHAMAFGFRIWQGSFFNMPRAHVHSDIEINYLFEGYAHYLHGGHVYHLEANQWAIFWGGIPHRVIEKSQRNHGVWLTLPLAWVLHWDLPDNTLSRLLAGDMLLNIATQPAQIIYDHYRLKLWQKEFRTGDKEQLRNVILDIEVQLRRMQSTESGALLEMSRSPTAVSSHQLASILTQITQNYMTLANVNAIAAAVQLHPKYLMQLFKKATGLNLWEYVIWLRVAHAQRLLLTSDDTIIDIALASGFNAPSTFYQAFRKYTDGATPREFRRQKSFTPQQNGSTQDTHTLPSAVPAIS